MESSTDRPTTSLPSPRPGPCAYYALTEILVCQWLALEDGNPGLSVAYAGRRKSGWTKGQQDRWQCKVGARRYLLGGVFPSLVAETLVIK